MGSGRRRQKRCVNWTRRGIKTSKTAVGQAGGRHRGSANARLSRHGSENGKRRAYRKNVSKGRLRGIASSKHGIFKNIVARISKQKAAGIENIFAGGWNSGHRKANKTWRDGESGVASQHRQQHLGMGGISERKAMKMA